jgi:hypothetical protein
MNPYFDHPADLATFGDLDAVLNKIGDITLREPVRQYYRILHWVQQIRSAKWCFFMLFFTMFISFELEVVFPTSKQSQALIALGIAFVVLTAMWMFEHAVFVYGGDPSELFETRDEELAIAHELGHIALNAQPHSMATSPTLRGTSNLGSLFVVPEDEASSDSSGSSSERAPLAKINKSAPRSPVVLSQLPTVYRVGGGGGGGTRQVRAGLLSFNASALKKQ